MKIKILLPILLTLALFTTGYAQTLDKCERRRRHLLP